MRITKNISKLPEAGGWSKWGYHLTSIGIPTMGFPVLVRQHLYVESGPSTETFLVRFLHHVIPMHHDDVIKWKHFPRYWLFVRGHRWIPAQKPVTQSDIFFDLRLNKQLSKQSWGWWFAMPSRSLWRHCNVLCVMVFGQFRYNYPNVVDLPHLWTTLIHNTVPSIRLNKIRSGDARHFRTRCQYCNWTRLLSMDE